jgi:hypothetical protein
MSPGFPAFARASFPPARQRSGRSLPAKQPVDRRPDQGPPIGRRRGPSSIVRLRASALCCPAPARIVTCIPQKAVAISVFASRRPLCYTRAARPACVFPGSSAVEQPAVNRLVAGSIRPGEPPSNSAFDFPKRFCPNWPTLAKVSHSMFSLSPCPSRLQRGASDRPPWYSRRSRAGWRGSPADAHEPG